MVGQGSLNPPPLPAREPKNGSSVSGATTPTRTIPRFLRLWFGVARLGIAVFLLWALVVNVPLRDARSRLLALPEVDHAAEVKTLREEGRLGEALVVADSISLTMGTFHGTALDRERRLTLEARESWLRKVKDAGWAAVTGNGTSGSALAGSTASDMLAVGDVRDLIVEGVKHAWPGGDDADPVMVELSTLGLATTVAPPVDAVPSILKWARRNGALSDELGAEVVAMVRDKRIFAAGGLMWDVSTIARGASPGGAVTILRGAKSSEDVARLAACVKRGPHGAAALVLTEEVGAKTLTSAPSRGIAAAREGVVVDASRRGSAGRVFLQSAAVKPLLRGHPLVRAAALLPTEAPALLASRGIQKTERGLWVWVSLAGVWATGELAWLGARWRRSLSAPE